MESRPRTDVCRTRTGRYARALAALACLLISGLVPQPTDIGSASAPVGVPTPGEEGESDTDPSESTPAPVAAPARLGRTTPVASRRSSPGPAHQSDFRPPPPPIGPPSRPHVLRC